MPKIIVLLLASILCFTASAQSDAETKYRLTSSSDIFGLGSLRLLDPYLSPLAYSGFGLGYEHDTRKLFKAENTKLSRQTKLSGFTGIALNPAFTAQMIFMGADYSWGMHYHFVPIQNLQVWVGGNANAEFAVKSLSRNVNNPVNIDVAANMNFSAEAIYDINLKCRTIKLKYSFEAPIYGGMFVPMGGASYYEMFEHGNLDNAIHFSSLHNKQGYDSALRIEIPFKHSTFQLGFSQSNLKYKANDMVFSKSISSIEIAWLYDLYIFSGMKNRAPQNFINSNF